MFYERQVTHLFQIENRIRPDFRKKGARLRLIEDPIGPFYADKFAAFHYVVGDKTDVVGQDEKGEVDRYGVTVLHIAVKDIEQFAVNGVEVLAHNNTGFVGVDGHNIHDLEETLIPYALGFAPEKGDVDLVVDVTDTIKIGVFVRLHADFLFVFELGARIRSDEAQELGVFSCAGRAIEDHVFELVNGFGHCTSHLF
jgi:hypothetical protein